MSAVEPAPSSDPKHRVHVEYRGDVALLRLSRPQKRNAIDNPTVLAIENFFVSLPQHVKAAVLYGEGEHFSAGLDLTELGGLDPAASVDHSRQWHRVFEQIEFGRVPVVAVLHGAVVGGGLDGNDADGTFLRCGRRTGAWNLALSRR
jgi:enoyl-CoA hydratase/carnithine racemase